MSLVTLKEIQRDTRTKKYAVPAFNFNGYEDAQGMINSAVKQRYIVVTSKESAMTDPAAVPRFVEETGIDALAIAIGTAI